MKIRLEFIYLFISVSQVACSQQKEIILKKCISDFTESFPSKNYTCQKLSFKDDNLVYKINYSYNGWQIIDSIAFLKEGGKDCIKYFQPIYNVENMTVKSYELLNVDCNQENVAFNNINDKYGLSTEYLGNIQFLLLKHHNKNNDEYRFQERITPSLFAQYGIPSNEPLRAFTYNIEGDLLHDDSFLYDSFILTRNYEYENELLKLVKIVVKDRGERIVSQFTESYEFELQ